MAPFGKIYSYPGNFRVRRAQFVAALNGLEVPLVEDFKMMQTNRTPEFLAKFPMGKVPALECADGFCVAESAAIASYLAASGPRAPQLLGLSGDAKARAKITEWSSFADWELGQHAGTIYAVAVGRFAPHDAASYDRAVSSLDRALRRLEVGLEGGKKKYLVGDELTLADCMVAGPLLLAAKFFIDAETRKTLPGVAQYIAAFLSMPEVKESFGDVELAEVRVKP